jgi:cytochrome c oxidase subunit IV
VKPIVIYGNFWIYVGVIAGLCYALMYYGIRGLMESL